MSISKEEIENICNLLTQLKRSNRIYLNNIFDTCLSQNIVRENLKFEYPFIKNNYDTVLYSFDKKIKVSYQTLNNQTINILTINEKDI